MIKDFDTAKRVNELVLAANDKLEQSVVLARERSTPEQADKYAQTIGFVIWSVFTKVLYPIYSLHPSLKPEELKEVDTDLG